MASTSMVHVRIDEKTKAQAAETLAEMGLSVSGAVRVFLTRIAAEKAIPFEVRSPNAETAKAIRELESGKGKRFGGVKKLMGELNAGD